MPLKGHKTQVSLILACEWLQELLCPGRQNQRWILRDLRACGEELARTLPIVTWSWVLSLPSCPSCILEEKMVGTNVLSLLTRSADSVICAEKQIRLKQS